MANAVGFCSHQMRFCVSRVLQVERVTRNKYNSRRIIFSRKRGSRVIIRIIRETAV